MAVGTKIVMEFQSNTGNKKYTLSYADSDATPQSVKEVMDAYIAATALLNVTLTGIIGAYIETTTREEYDLPE